MGTDKTLPYSMDAEKAIIGSILLESTVPADVRANDFYFDGHRKIISCVQLLADNNEAINLISVKNQLQRDGELESVGGAAYLASLTDGVPRMEMAPQMFRIIRSKAALRKLIEISHEAMNRGYVDQEDPQSIISYILDGCDEANAIMDESGGLTPISSLVNLVYGEIESRSDRKTTSAIATGFRDLDLMMSGGIRPSNSVIIAGRPGSGKTAFLTNILMNMGSRGVPTAFFELEMSAQEIIERMICIEGRVDGGRIRTGFLDKEDWKNITKAATVLSNYPIFIDDSTGVRISDIRARMRKAQQKYKNRFELCAVDYLQLINPPESLRRNADDNAQVAAVSKGLKSMAKSMDIGVAAVSQLSRASEKRRDQRPQLSDLRSSGQIEQDADVVMFVYREEMYDPTEENSGQAEIILAKQRSGPIGEVKLAYAKQFTAFGTLYEGGDDAGSGPIANGQ